MRGSGRCKMRDAEAVLGALNSADDSDICALCGFKWLGHKENPRYRKPSNCGCPSCEHYDSGKDPCKGFECQTPIKS